MALKKKSTVNLHPSQGKVYFRTAIPRSVAVDILGLKADVEKQELTWRIEKGRVVVEKQG